MLERILDNSNIIFSFTRSRSRLRVKNSRSRSRLKTGRLRNPASKDSFLLWMLASLNKFLGDEFARCPSLQWASTVYPIFFFFLSVTWIDFVCNADADPGIWIQMWIQIQGVKNLTRTSFLSLWTFMVLSQRTPGLWDDCFLWKFPPVVVLASFAPTCSLLSGSKWCET